jgi:uncharacterized protein YndB with AHSA1/START domain
MNQLLQLATPAGPSDVWRALTSPELTARYLYGMEATSSWRAGAPLRLAGPGEAMVTGEVLAAAAPQRLSYSLQAGHGHPATYVTWEIYAANGGSVVRLYVDEPDDLTSEGPDPEAAAAWAEVLDRLAAVLAPASAERLGPSFR